MLPSRWGSHDHARSLCECTTEKNNDGRNHTPGSSALYVLCVVGWHHYKLTSIVPLLSTALYKNATRQFIIIAARWGGCVFISYSPWYSFLFLFVCLSLDLTPAEQQLLVEIRRRKTELLHEIQVQLYTIILEHTQQKEPLTAHVEWWNRHGENGMKEIGREREKGKKTRWRLLCSFFFLEVWGGKK